MKLMKLGTRPDSFFTSGPVRYCLCLPACLPIRSVRPKLPMDRCFSSLTDELVWLVRRRCDSRSVYTEVATDLQIQVDRCLFRLHKVDETSILLLC